MTDLLNSKHFCILPFISSRIWHGTVVPCCMNHEVYLGNTKEKSLLEIYGPNNTEFNNFRKELINGQELPKSCNRCYANEKNNVTSYRQHMNKTYGHLLDKIKFDTEGSVQDMKIYFFDGLGFSNLCNLKCRMCPSFLSTTNREEELTHNRPIKKMTDIQKDFVNKELNLNSLLLDSFSELDEFFLFMDSHCIDTLEEIKFEGGEPLIIEEHYKVLEYLISKKRNNVRLKYCTNLTKTKLKHYDIFSLWKQFSDINVIVSLDSINEQNDYIRHPSNFNNIIQNIDRIKTQLPHVKISSNTTMQLLNSFSMTKLYSWLLENDIPQTIIYLSNPSNMSMNVLPKMFKERVTTHWELYKNSLPEHVNTSNIDGFLRMMNSIDHSDQLPEFLKFTHERDKIRGENFYETFPEFKDLK